MVDGLTSEGSARLLEVVGEGLRSVGVLVMRIVVGVTATHFSNARHHVVGLSCNVALELEERLGACRGSLIRSFVALEAAKI